MDTNLSPGLPPESTRVRVSESVPGNRSPGELRDNEGIFGALNVSSLLKSGRLDSPNLRLVVSLLVAVVSIAGSIFWLSNQTETLNESAIPTVTSLAREASLSAQSPSTDVEVDIVIHVAGAVVSPGVVSVSQGSRVVDAVNAAGGPATEADLHSLNLAQVVEDGTSIVVPAVGQTINEPSIRPPTVGEGKTNGGSSSTPININVASTDELQKLNGVGPSTAASIIEWREAHGDFVSAEDLLGVPGIGPAKLAAMRDDIAT